MDAPEKPAKPRKPQDPDYVRKRVPVQKLQKLIAAIEEKVAADKEAPQDKKLSAKELVSLCNSAASLARPLALADKDAADQTKKKLKAASSQTVWSNN
jgi:hypothetical protein